MDEVAIYAEGNQKLIVELKHPTPYFLGITSMHVLAPISKKWDQKHPKWADHPEEGVVGNGPFVLQNWQHHQVKVGKNKDYWDAKEVKIDHIVLSLLDEATALALFESGDLDWVGSPLSTIPAEALPTLQATAQLKNTAAAGTAWFRFNTSRMPFQSRKMRKSFGHALNRQEIVEHVLQGNQLPATGIVPPSMQLQDTPYFADHDVSLARRLFQEALQEMQLTKEELPVITLSYSTAQPYHKIAQAVQQQWKEAFGVEVRLQQLEANVYYDQLKTGNYSLAIGSWFGDINDPINFLEVFKYQNNGTNNTFWENNRYIKLLDLSAQVGDQPGRRQKVLQSAEELLIYHMPVAPLFHFSFNYMKRAGVEGVYLSELGFLDFKYTRIIQE